jgi:PAS domain S-box-containing protein
MLVIDPQDGRIFDANPAASKYYGWRREELLGMHINDINTLTPEQISLEMQRAHGQNRVHFEFRHRRSDGSVQDVEVYSGPIMLQGREMLYSLVFDITTRKRTEEALIHSHELLRYIIEHDHNSVAVYDRDLRYIYVSERFRKEYRIQDTDIIGRYHYDVFPDVPLKWREAHQRALAGEVLSADEDMFDRLDGRVDWVRWECRPWYEADGSIGGIILYTEVITERKQLEEQLRQAQKMESIGHLAGGVAHDFNNILAIILIQTELALMKIRHDDPLSARLQEIRKAAKRSANLTRQLLAFARKQTISPAVLNLNETVTEMLKMLRRLIGEDIDLTWLPGDQVWSVNIDPSQMDQILANLCVNARDAITGIGQVIIETANVTIQKGDYIALTEAVSGDFVLLTVSDNGRGMDKATLARIFEPFFTTKEIGHGTGLGLATVYGIVKQNGGLIHAYSEQGQGTTFKIYLPRYVDDTKVERVERQDVLMLGYGETVLLVEDEPAILEVSKAMLDILGYTLLASNSPREALQLAARHSGAIDLLITDVIMPEMNGLDLSIQLRTLIPGLETIYISGYPASVIAQKGVLQVENYIQKPFSMKDLAAKIRTVLAKSNKRVM